jgi:hypothetical protein
VVAVITGQIVQGCLSYAQVRATEERTRVTAVTQRRLDVVAEYSRDSTTYCAALAVLAREYVSLSEMASSREHLDSDDQAALLDSLNAMRHADESAVTAMSKFHGTCIVAGLLFGDEVKRLISVQQDHEADLSKRIRRSLGLDPLGATKTLIRQPERLKALSGIVADNQRLITDLAQTAVTSSQDIMKAMGRELASRSEL